MSISMASSDDAHLSSHPCIYGRSAGMPRRSFVSKGLAVSVFCSLLSTTPAQGMERLPFKPDGYNFWAWRGHKIHYVVHVSGTLDSHCSYSWLWGFSTSLESNTTTLPARNPRTTALATALALSTGIEYWTATRTVLSFPTT